MKLVRSTGVSCSRRQRQRGVAVLVVLTLLAILLIFIAGNVRALRCLDQELKLVERRQIKRLNALSATNAPAAMRAAITNAPAAAGEARGHAP